MSSTPLLPTITEAGLNAIWRASNDGVSAQITHIALGDAAYTPNQGMTRLQSERARYPVADGKRLTSRQIHLTALADGNAEFWVREVGFYLADGTCLAIWSDPAKLLAYKAGGVDLLLAYDLTLSAVPADSVTVQSTGAGLNLAVAEELAALATGQICEMQRSVERSDQLEAMGRRLAIAENRHVFLSGQHQALAGQYAASQTDALTAIAANAAAIVQLQHSFAKTTLGV